MALPSFGAHFLSFSQSPPFSSLPLHFPSASSLACKSVMLARHQASSPPRTMVHFLKTFARLWCCFDSLVPTIMTNIPCQNIQKIDPRKFRDEKIRQSTLCLLYSATTGDVTALKRSAAATLHLFKRAIQFE